MLVETPKGQYLKKIDILPQGVSVEFGDPKKVALVFICLNENYWPYLTQVLQDCKKHFLKNHKVDFLVWTDYTIEKKKKQLSDVHDLLRQYTQATPEKKQEAFAGLLNLFSSVVRLYQVFYPNDVQAAVQQLAAQGIFFKMDGQKFWLESARPALNDNDVLLFHNLIGQLLTKSQQDLDSALEGTTIIETDAAPWPSPTLMRYHLFLNEEEKLKEYDQIFYMDADMRVVADIGDEILSNGLTAAEHPMYSLRQEYVPPYEPNSNSTAYIKRPGKVVVDENGKPRFKPYYYAGGFQGGLSKEFIKAMRVMKKNIDIDFEKINYIAIWNDESHWNKYLADYKEPDIVLSPSYIYPDSLIKEYYTPLWGTEYSPKIITLTKPFSLSKEGAEAINKIIKK